MRRMCWINMLKSEHDRVGVRYPEFGGQFN
jgi:hypothetical protein